MLKNNETIASVLKTGLCTGCGTCAGICPQDAVEMIIDHRKGIYLPQIDENKCNGCGLCYQVCPGHSVDFQQLGTGIFGEDIANTHLGNYSNCYIGHASDNDIRYNAASGGLVTALLVSALEEGLIDGALVVKMREDSPLEPQPFIARTRDEIIAASKSKYCPVSANVALKEIMEREGKYAVVGLPCHIHGVWKEISVIPKLKERIVFCLSLCCSHCDTFSGTEFLLREYIGKDHPGITKFDYRGYGWPGYMMIRFKDGKVTRIHYHYIVFHTLWFFAQKRCIFCCDSLSRLSDVTVMDAWLPEIRESDSIGTSLIIARIEAGERLCQNAKLNRAVKLEPIDSDKVIQSQGKDRSSNRDLMVSLLFRKLLGQQLPEYGLSFSCPGIINFLRMLLIHWNTWVSSRKSMWWLIKPLYHIEPGILKIFNG